MFVRFDLIFLILDPQNEIFDRRLARHLVTLYYKSREEEEDEILVRKNYFDFIAISSRYCYSVYNLLKII